MSQEGDSEELLGRIWCDRYQILEYVGRGGMGAVYKARQVHIGREVALKVIHRRLCKDDKQIQRFEQEARTSSKLNHPNSIRVFDYGKSDDGRLFMAMEFLKGKTLGKLISERGTLPPRQVSHVARQMFKSLAEAHQLGLVHRDLKPENIFICDIFGETDFVKVLDFGIAKAIGPTEEDAKLTQTGFICGTPRYLSPEQALGQEVDGRADLYSVGVLMYEMLTGRPPFVGENPISIVMKHVHDEPPPMTGLERYGQEVQPLVQLISHLLQKNPARRPAPAERIAQFLDGTIDQAALMGSAVVDTATIQRRMPSSLQNLSGMTSPHLPSSQVTSSTSPPQYRDPSLDRPTTQASDGQPSRVRRTRAPAPPPLPFEAMARQEGEGEAYDPQANATVLTARPEELLGATITEASRHSQDDFMPPTITEASPPSSQVTSVISRSSMQSSLDPKPPSSPTINIQKRPAEPARATIKRPDSDRARISQNVKERHPPKQAKVNTQPTMMKPRGKAGPVWAWALAVLAVVSMVAYGLFSGDTPAEDARNSLPTQAASRVTVIPPAVQQIKKTAPVDSAAVVPIATPSSAPRPSGVAEPPVVAPSAPGARVGVLLATAAQSKQGGVTPPVEVPAASAPASSEPKSPSKRAEPISKAGQGASKPPEAMPTSGGVGQNNSAQKNKAELEVKKPPVKPQVVTPAKAKAAPPKARKKKKRKPRAAVKPATESIKPKPKRRSKPKPKAKPKKKSVDFEVF